MAKEKTLCEACLYARKSQCAYYTRNAILPEGERYKSVLKRSGKCPVFKQSKEYRMSAVLI